MVELPEGFCIDSKEVTRHDYRLFYESNPSNPMNPGCEPNASFVPGCSWSSGTDDLPATCVDWCDAYAYCQANGKRLCGAIQGGGAVSYTSFDDPDVSEWQAACSSHGAHTYPYGDSAALGRCVDNSIGQPQPVGSKPMCQAYDEYACVFDLAGNVWEWDNSCDAPGAAECRLRGGSCVQGGALLYCHYDAHAARLDNDGANIGFRCCADDCP
jgi:formylglycine-generating enzyme required for sulfatase activity